MPRAKITNKRQKEPDTKFKSRIVAKMITEVMLDGKKSIATKIVYDMMDKLNNDDPKESRRYFEEAVKNVMPDMEVKSRRVGGANYQIPMPVRHDRSETLAIRWLVDAARSQKGTAMVTKLTNEIKAAYKKEGTAFSKKVNTHKMADANKAFSHFKW